MPVNNSFFVTKKLRKRLAQKISLNFKQQQLKVITELRQAKVNYCKHVNTVEPSLVVTFVQRPLPINARLSIALPYSYKKAFLQGLPPVNDQVTTCVRSNP